MTKKTGSIGFFNRIGLNRRKNTPKTGSISKVIAFLVGFALLMGGCSSNTRANLPTADNIAKQLETGFTLGKLPADVFSDDLVEVQADYDVIVGGMDAILPKVEVETIDYFPESSSASVALKYSYQFGEEVWSYVSKVPLKLTDGKWLAAWSPSVVHPELTDQGRLSHSKSAASRAPIIDRNGRGIVENRDVFKLGLDKTQVDSVAWESSARQIAAVTGVDEASYLAQVKASGPQAFVVALTVRAGQVPANFSEIAGSRAIESTLPLAPTPDFARPILGVAGEATKEIIDSSDGKIRAGDIVGLSGLQKTFDEKLRGTEGHKVRIVQRKTPSTVGKPVGSSPTQSTDVFEPKELFNQNPKVSEPLKLSMDFGLQEKAEAVLNSQPGVASIVVIEPSSGGVLAAANSPAGNIHSVSTAGFFPPGSTFKTVVSLAMLRSGLTPDSIVDCPKTLTINGRQFTNHSGYPDSMTGKITLQQAFENSCNTVFLGQAQNLSYDQLLDAAGSLGLGTDYKTGFGASYGIIPKTDDPVMWASDMIGQGEVQVSPLAMANVAASVASGKTVIGWLAEPMQPQSTRPALTESEVNGLRQLMSGVVSNGTGRSLKGVVDGAKTGSAQYGTDNPPKTHGWMIAYTTDFAIAVFVQDAPSGSGTAAPIVKQFLS